MSSERSVRRVATGLAALATCLALVVPSTAITLDPDEEGGSHLLISEVMPSGASASDEFIELYNPGPVALPLEGLELIYVSASGGTVSARAEWPAGAPVVGSGRHVLVANEAGAFASIADALYASGIAAAGGSVAIRIQGAASAIDAVGWGTAASAWLEGAPAPAPTAGSSIERLPGGASGSTQDSDSNAADFAEIAVPDPQNSTSPPVPDPDPGPLPTPGPTPVSTPAPTALPTPIPPPSGATPIADVRALPDGSRATISAVALTSSDFTDGGGYVTDGSGGIAVLVTGGTYERGDTIVATGEVDDRYHQRTLRVDAADLEVLGTGTEPQAARVSTGGVGEAHEATLVAITATVDGPPSALSGATAFDVDDGSGPTRVVVHDLAGIDTSAWDTGAVIEVVGVVGQRDSTGGGTAGYRVQPRSPEDIGDVTPPDAGPGPSGSSGASASPSPTVTAEALSTIAQARAAAEGTRLRVRGVVTLGTGTVEDGSAVIQDASGAIVLRMSGDAGRIGRGQLVDVRGTRSTKAGMVTLRVSEPPDRAGNAVEPAPVRRTTGAAGERDEARLVVVRGSLVANARRASSGSVSFEIDDGSGPLRVFVAAGTGISAADLEEGDWIEVRGVLGQQTSGAQPTAGYRVWPRDAADLRVVASAIDDFSTLDEQTDGSGTDGGHADASAAGASLAALLAGNAAGRPATATLVTGQWDRLQLAGVVWDGSVAVGLADAPPARAAVQAALADGAPVAIRIRGASSGILQGLRLPLIRIGANTELSATAAAVSPPATAIPTTGGPVWARLTGFLRLRTGGPLIETASTTVPLDVRCTTSPLDQEAGSLIQVEGLAIPGTPGRLVVACDDVAKAPNAARGSAPRIQPSTAPATDAPAMAPLPLDDRRVAGALTLTAAAAILAGACGWRAWRRLAHGTGAADDAVLDDSADGDGEGDPDDESTRLTLVSLPRKRGSP